MRGKEHLDLSNSQRCIWAQWADPCLICQPVLWNKPCRCKMAFKNRFLPGWNGAAECSLGCNMLSCTHLAGKAGIWYGSGLYGREISQELHTWKSLIPGKHLTFLTSITNLLQTWCKLLRRSWTLSLERFTLTIYSEMVYFNHLFQKFCTQLSKSNFRD